MGFPVTLADSADVLIQTVAFNYAFSNVTKVRKCTRSPANRCPYILVREAEAIKLIADAIQFNVNPATYVINRTTVY